MVVIPNARAAKPDLLQAALQPLSEHRRAGGLRTGSIMAPATTPEQREVVRGDLAKMRPRFVLLVGDVDVLPAFDVTHPGSQEAVTTDRPWGDFDDDGFPEAAVGRIPTSDPALVARVVERIINYETSRDAGPWRRECALVAGEARYSPQLDAVIEQLFARVVTEEIAPGYAVDLTYANPRSRYCYPPARFSERVVGRFNEGALVYAYVGHGAERSVDDLHLVGPEGGRPKRFPVLGVEQVGGLAADGRPPIMAAIACWTGRFEAKQPCIGEELLLAEGGPVAFYGATRISHPVHNALLAKAIVGQLLAGTGEVRLGEALDRAERIMVSGPQTATASVDPIRLQILTMARAFLGGEAIDVEFPRHVDMYNLLGDPALVVARPEGEVALDLPAQATAGAPLTVRGRVAAGSARAVTVTLETERGTSARRDAPAGETPVEAYARANDRVVWTELASVNAAGEFEVALPLPRALAAGKYVVTAFAQGEGACALGAGKVQIAAAADYDPFEEEEGWSED